MKSFFSFLSLCLVSTGLIAEPFNPLVTAGKMQSDGMPVTSGTHPDCGLWVISCASVPLDGRSEKDALALAALESRKELGAYLSSQIATASQESTTEDASGVKSTFATWARSDVSALLRGVRLEKNRIENGAAVAVAVLTERSIDASGKLAKAMDTARPGTVEATGEGATREVAIQAACRSALEQVCGVSSVASDQSVDGTVRSRAFTDVQGAVSAYRILEEKTENGLCRVKIAAMIDKNELQESYGAQLKSIGEPVFFVNSSNDDCARLVCDWMVSKNMKTAERAEGADYKVEVLPKFSAVEHPVSGRQGMQLQLSIVCYDKAGIELFTIQNDPRKAASFVGTPDRQKQLVAEKAFRQLEQPLHERVQKAISSMVNNGRTVRLVFRNVTTAQQNAQLETLANEINDMPAACSAVYSRNEPVAVAIVRFSLKGNLNDFISLLRTRITTVPAALLIEPNKAVFEF